MNRRFCAAALLLALLASPAFAQEQSAQDAAGQFQVSLVLGNNTMFNQNTSEYLLPTYDNTSSTPGTGIGSGDDESSSADPGVYLNLGELGSNSLLNMVGVQGRYFITSAIDVNLMFAMNIAATPKKDYIEGDESISDMAIPASRYIEGRLKTSMMANVGSNWHFATKNDKLSLYAGVAFGGQFGKVETTRPYTGDNETVIYTPSSRAGRIWALSGSIVGGIEFIPTSGLVLGLEVAPAAYQYSQMEVYPKGYETYAASHHNIKFFATPNFKIGFRF